MQDNIKRLEQLEIDNKKLVKKCSELHQQKSEIESDIRTTVEVFHNVTKTLGIKMDDFKKGEGDIGAKIPQLVSSLSIKLMTGGIDVSAISGVTSLSPIMEKYQYLVDDIIQD